MMKLLLLFLCICFHPTLSTIILVGAGSNLDNHLIQAAIETYLSTASDGTNVQIGYFGLGSSEGTCRLENYTQACALSDTAAPTVVDFAASDVILAQSDYQLYPDIQMYPLAAVSVVPVYNLPCQKLVLTAEILAKIYLMHITSWLDSQILELNPNLRLQLQNISDPSIKVCGRQDSSGTSFIFTSYLSAATNLSVPEFQTIGVSSLPSWANGTHLAVKAPGIAALISNQLGSIGYIGFYDAEYYELAMACIRKPDTSEVAPSSTSLAYAAAEFAMEFGNNGEDPSHLTADIHNAKSAFAWPIAGYTYLVLRKNETRSGASCLYRYETVKFWYWFYTSSAANLLINFYGYVPLAENARTFVVNKLQSNIYCNRRMVFKEVPPPSIRLGLTSFFLENLRFLFEGAYLSISPRSSYNYQIVNQSMSFGSLDAALVKGPPFSFTTSLSASDMIAFPFAGIAYCFVVNLCYPNNPDCRVGATKISLGLTGEFIFKILTGKIYSWDDPELVKNHPYLANIDHNITVVLSEGMLEDLQELNFAFPSWMSSFVFDPSKLNAKIVSSNTAALLEVTAVPYTLTYLHYNSDIAARVLLPLSADPIMLTSVARTDGTAVLPSLDSMRACTTDTYIPSTNKVNPLTSKNQACYPLTQSYRFLARKKFISPVCNDNSAVVQTMKFLAWLFKRGTLTSAYESLKILPLFSLNDQIYRKTKEQLLSVTCNGVSVLAQPSNYNYISSWATPVAWTLSGLVLFSGVGFVCWLYWKRKHQVVRFAQIEFMCLIILGAIMITFSLVPLSLDDSGIQYYSLDGVLDLGVEVPQLNSACTLVPWLYVTGFALEFSALFSKVWRLKQIFLAKQMKRISLTFRHMVPILLVCLCVGWFLCAVWTGVAPLQWQRIAVTYDSTGYMVDSYAHCTSKQFLGFYSATTLFQLACLFYGMVLCYQTRNVKEDFVENKWITIVLINMITTVILTVMLGFFMRENPSALFGIEVINGLITGFGVMVVMIAPKIQMVHRSSPSTGGANRFSAVSPTFLPTNSLHNTHNIPSYSPVLTPLSHPQSNPVSSPAMTPRKPTYASSSERKVEPL